MKAIIGIGNPLKRDDGIGIHLIEKLRKEDISEDIDILDCGTGGMKLVHDLKDLDSVLIVDSVMFGGEPGESVFFTPEEIKSLKVQTGTHDSDLFEILSISESMGEAPDKVIIMGIQPKQITFGEEISEPLKKKVQEYMEKIKKKVEEI